MVMLRFINSFRDVDILSLRNGRPIGKVGDPIINPNNLSIEAFYAHSPRESEHRVIFAADIRELSVRGVIVDSEDNLMELEGLVRLEKVLAIDFQMMDKKVVTKSGKSVGKVMDYVVDDKGYEIQKIYVRPAIVKAFTKNDLIIGRNQIVEVNDKKIVVKDTDIKVGSKIKKPAFNPLAQ